MKKSSSEPLLIEFVPILNEITAELGDPQDPIALYNTVVKICLERFQAEASSLFIEEPDGDTINMVAGTGYHANIVGQARYMKKEGITGNVWAYGKPFKADNHDELVQHEWHAGKMDKKQWKEEKHCWSIIVVPLIIGERVLGVLKVENKLPGSSAFTENEFKILQTIAGVVSLAVENAELAERSHTIVLKALQKAVAALSGFESYFTNILYAQIVATCRDILNANAASLYLESDDRSTLKMVAGEGYSKDLIGQEYSRREGITGHIWSEGVSLKLDDIKSLKAHPWHLGKYDKQQWKDNQYCWSLLAVPLRIRDNIIGVLKVEDKHPEPSAFTVSDQRLLEMIASIVAFSVHNEQSGRRLQEAGLHAYNYAHTSKNYLAILSNFILTLGDVMPQETQRDLEKRIKIVDTVIKNMQRYAKDILDIAKVSRAIPEVIKLTDIYGVLCARWDIYLKQRKIRFLNKLEVEDVLIVVDKTMLYVILDNLIQNSIEAVMTLQQHDAEYSGVIGLFAIANEDVVSVYICDNAIGIAPENVSKLFVEKFTTKQNGNGLGLTIVKRYVEENRGTINYHNALPLEVSTINPNFNWKIVFCLTFPRGQRAKLYSVLIVDDEELFSEYMSAEFSMRSSFGVVDRANNCSDTISAVKAQDYDVIILDLWFQKPPHGQEIYLKLRNAGYKGLVIMYSSHQELIDEAHQLEDVADIINKENARSIPEKCEKLLSY